MQDDQLAEFQAILLEALYNETKAEEIEEILSSKQVSALFQTWINQFQPHMLELGAGIAKNYCKRK